MKFILIAFLLLTTSATVAQINGSSLACPSSTVSYTATVFSWSYQWSVTGGTIVGASDGTSVSILWNSTTSGLITLQTDDGTYTKSISKYRATASINNSSTICAGDSKLLSTTYTGTFVEWQESTNGGSSWSSAGSTSNLYIFPTTTTQYRARVSGASGCSTIYSNIITVNVYSPLTPGSISGAQTICYNTTPATITSTSAASGNTGSYSYQWQQYSGGNWVVINGATGTSYSPGALTATTEFRRLVTTSCTSEPSNTITVIVYPPLASGSISNSSSVICSGSAAPVFSDVAASGGNYSYAYEWQQSVDNVNWYTASGTNTNASYAPPVQNVTTFYRRRVVSCGQEAYTSSVPISVYSSLGAGSIANASTSICAGSAAPAFTASNASGSNGSYAYQWEQSLNNSSWSNATGSSTSATYSPSTQTVATFYRRRVSACNETVYSNTITISVYGTVTGGTIANATLNICPATSPSAFTSTANASQGNGSYNYQWEQSADNANWSNASGSSTAATYAPPALSNTTYFRRRVASCGVNAYSNTVAIQVYSALQPGTIAISTPTVCSGTAPASITSSADASGSNGSYSYVWQQSTNNVSWVNATGSNTGTTYTPPALTSAMYYRRSVSACGQTVYSNSIAVNVYPALHPGGIQSGTPSMCAGSIPNAITSYIDPSGGSGSYTYLWLQSSNATDYYDADGANTNMTYNPPALNTTMYYKRRVTSCGVEATSHPTEIIVSTASVGGTIGGGQEAYGSASGNLTLSNHTGSIQKWQQKIGSGSWTDITNTTTSLPYTSINTTTHYKAVVKSGDCAAVDSEEETILIHAVPSITINGPSVIAPGGSTELIATANLDFYNWYKNGSPISGASTHLLTVTEPGLYKVIVRATNTSPEYATGEIDIEGTLSNPIVDMNYVRSTTFNVPLTTDQIDAYPFTASDFILTTTYFDGLGRPVQSVALGASGNGNDLITPVEYDAFGREAKKYLPFAHANRDGRYQPTALTDQGLFYNNTADRVADDTAPYSQTIFEPSPLNRVIKQGAPGLAWQPDADHTYNSADHSVKFSYEFNLANEVRIWKHAYSSPASPLGIVTGTGTNTYYAPNQLYKNKTKDEHQHEIIEYVDKEGRTVLKRVQVVDGQVQINDTNYASTYYVYDDFGNLVSVIQPEGSKLLTATFKPFSWTSVSGYTISPENTLTKTSSTGYSNSGAFLSSGLAANTNGWVRMVALETTTSRMIGFTTANAGNDNNISFAIELASDGYVYVWEDGIKKNNLGNYTSGTSVMVSREAGYIKYYVSETEKHISEKTTPTSLSTSVLYLDATINDQGGTIQNLDISFSSEKRILKNFSFQYAYDGRQRMIAKQVPGAEPVYMVYDNRDRLVMTQDGNQRAAASVQYWTFTKYDALNRPVATGLKDTTAVVSQRAMQAHVNEFYTKPNSRYYEEYVGNVLNNLHGYSNKSFPTTNRVTTAVGYPDASYYLTLTYYDDYAAIAGWDEDYLYSDLDLEASGNGINYEQPNNYNSRVKGQVTATKTKVLDGGVKGGYTWLKAVNYFDDKYRLIQSINDNYKGGIDRATNVIDFSGKVLLTNTEQITRDIVWKDISNIELIGNKMLSSPTKVNAWGNAGAASTEQLPAGQDGWIEFTVFQEWGTIILGLSDQNVDNNYNTIDYGIYFGGATVVRPYENGVTKSYSPYGIKAGDILKIERLGTQVKYYQNGILLYTSTVPSTTSLVADIAIFDKNISVVNVRSSFSQRINEVKRRFDYDHAGRLINTWHSINDQPEILLAHNEYNEIGQLIDKKLHLSSPDEGGLEVAKQSIDYAYNIRGWLTHINDAALTPQANESKDYFGMELAYNTDLGTGNPSDKLQYNGNINAIKWSNNQGLGDQKENAYNFTYDPLNRLKTADFKQKDSAWGLAKYRDTNGIMQSVDAFKEYIGDYDLNGNIKQLQRSGQEGSLIDNLTYDYGASSYASNRLERVTDIENDEQGFKEVNSSIGDYGYDSNGNLVYDRNKSSEDLLINGEFNEGSSYWTSTEPARLTFANDRVEITTGSIESVLTQEVVIKNGANHVVNINLVRTSATGSLNVRVGGSSTNYTISASTSLSIFSHSAGTDDVKIIATPDFAGYIESISVHAVTAIRYNYLNLPETVYRGDEGNIQYIYTATGQKLAQVVTEGTKTKTTDYVGEFVYQNDTLQFINHEEGRISLSSGSPLSPGEGQGGEALPEYQYHLKDHLGNVRLTFTTKDETEETLATLETTNENEERANFLKYDDIRKVNSTLFDHTHAPGVAGATQYAMRLSGTPAETYGLARSIAVMPGDVLSAEVFAKYVDLSQPDVTTALEDFIGAIVGGTSTPGTIIDGGGYGSPGAGSIPYGNLLNKSSEGPGAPKAYLNWIVFDKNFVPLVNKSGFDRISTAARENGSLAPEGIAHEQLTTPTIEITEPGYVYIYLSNEEPGTEVYFDDFKVTHTKSPVIQSDDYYPFGLTFNSYSRENSTKNNYLYNGMELQDELDLSWMDHGARMYMPELGKWGVIDPLADAQEDFSPYHFSYNNPILYNDPTGMIGESVNGDSGYATWVHNTETDEYLWIDDGYYFTFDVSNDEFNNINAAGSIKDAGGAVYNRWFWRAVLEELRGNPGKDEADQFIQDWYIGIWADAAIGIYEGNVTDAALRIGAGKLKNLKKFARWVRTGKNVTNKIPGTAKGGQVFEDKKGKLPRKDKDGKPITYREYDVNPAPQHGAKRGKERMVIGSDGSAYYTNDHYETFTPFKY